jgi:hypothetical protein
MKIREAKVGHAKRHFRTFMTASTTLLIVFFMSFMFSVQGKENFANHRREKLKSSQRKRQRNLHEN